MHKGICNRGHQAKRTQGANSSWPMTLESMHVQLVCAITAQNDHRGWAWKHRQALAALLGSPSRTLPPTDRSPSWMNIQPIFVEYMLSTQIEPKCFFVFFLRDGRIWGAVEYSIEFLPICYSLRSECRHSIFSNYSALPNRQPKAKLFGQAFRDAIPGLSQDPANMDISIISAKLLPCLEILRALSHHHTFRSKVAESVVVLKRHHCQHSGTKPVHLYCRFDRELAEQCSNWWPVTCASVSYGRGYLWLQYLF